MKATLLDLVNRTPEPEGWTEGDNIPWNDPCFSRRLLQEHLNQNHDKASRQFEKIEQHVNWIHEEILEEKTAKILDLCCGPGFYTSNLSKKGHQCVGIDFSPASIHYAQEQAGSQRLNCEYHHEDIRFSHFGKDFGMVMILFGEFNIFRPHVAKEILSKAYDALDEGGVLLLEAQTHDAIETIGRTAPFWRSTQNGLFSSSPHLYMDECFWDSVKKIATKRYHILDALTGRSDQYAQSFQAYTNDDFHSILSEVGFHSIQKEVSLNERVGYEDEDFITLIARK